MHRYPLHLLCLAATALALTSCTKPEPATPTSDTATPASTTGPLAKFSFSDASQSYDLAQGPYLLAMLSATCDHCRASVPKLNELTFAGALPPLLGIMMGTEAEIEDFRAVTHPEFPTHGVPSLEFMEFIDTAPPRLIYSSNGNLVKAWDWEASEDIPTADQIAQAIAAGK